MKKILTLNILLVIFLHTYSQHSFNPVTQTVGLTVNSQNLGQAVGWGDIDNDGDLDIAYSYSNPPEFQLYRNDGGIYTNITNSSGLAGISAWSIFWAEVTGDTLNDLISRNTLYINNGDYTFSASGSVGGQISSIADFNKDGDLDLFDRSIPGIKAGDGNGNFSDEYPLNAQNVRTTVCFDYDLDGDIDILAGTGASYQNKLFRNDGNMVFTDVSDGSGLLMQNDIYGLAAGDINNDGYPDIYAAVHKDQLQNPGNYLFRNNGDGTFTDITQSAGTPGQPSTRTASFADVNNDGWSDLLVDDHYHGNFLYLNNGDETFDEVADELNIRDVSTSWEIGGDYFGTSWGDYNLDGAIDFFGSGHMSRQKLYENQNCPNNFLVIELTGTVSSYNAVGSRVEILAGEMHTYHSIITGDGGCNLHSYPLEIGLGDNTIVDEIRIFWQNSEPQYLYDIPANQYLSIIEGDPVGMKESMAHPGIEIVPNPGSDVATIQFNLEERSDVTISLHSTYGKLVSRIYSGIMDPGTHKHKLDCNRFPKGIYIVKLQIAEIIFSEKLIIQ